MAAAAPGSIEPLKDGPAPTPGGSTTAQLKADISNTMRNKVILNTDHGLSQLGTDDEAGGDSPTPELIDQMRQLEAQQKPAQTATPPGLHDQNQKPFPIAIALTLAVVVALGLLWFFLLRAG